MLIIIGKIGIIGTVGFAIFGRDVPLTNSGESNR